MCVDVIVHVTQVLLLDAGILLYRLHSISTHLNTVDRYDAY